MGLQQSRHLTEFALRCDSVTVGKTSRSPTALLLPGSFHDPPSMTFANFGLLLCQALIYFTIMALLFRARRRFGLGLFVCALGVMHFLETYLASVFYI